MAALLIKATAHSSRLLHEWARNNVESNNNYLSLQDEWMNVIEFV